MAKKFEVKGISEFTKEFEEATKVVDKNKASLESLLLTAIDINKEFSKNSSFKSFVKGQEKVKLVNKEITVQAEQYTVALKLQQQTEKALITQIEKKKILGEGTAKALTKERLETQKLNKELKLQAQVNASVEGSLERVKKVNIQLKIERDKLNLTTAEGRKEQQKLNALIDKNTEFIKENTDAQTKQTLNVGKYSAAVEKVFPFFGKLQAGLQEISENTKSVGDGIPFVNGLKSSIAGATKASLAFIATPLGIAITAFAAIGLVTKEFLDYNNEIRETLKLTEDLTGLTGKNAASTRAEIQAISSVFDKDFKETLISANSVSKNFGLSFSESLDLIQDGLVRGADTNGDYLTQLKQYPSVFRNIGFSAQEFNNLIIKQQQEGVFDDKLVDAIKESDLALKEFTKTQQEALENAFGKEFSDDLSNKIRTGAITSKDAILEIGEEADKLGLDFQQLQQLTADVFKGAGEDAGGFNRVLEVTRLALSEETKELTKLQAAQLELSEATRELEKAKDEAFNSESARLFQEQLNILVTIIKTSFFEGVSELRKGFNSLTDGLNSVIEPFKDLIGTSPILSKLFNALKDNVFKILNPFTKWQILLKGVGATLSGLGAVMSAVKNNFTQLGKAFKDIDFSSPLTAVKSIGDAYQNLKKDTLDLSDAFAKGFSDSIKKSNENSKVIQEDAKKTAAELKAIADKKKQETALANKEAEAERKGILALNKFRLEQQAKAQEEILLNEQENSLKRIEAALNLERIRKEILDLSTNEQLKDLKDGSASKILVEEQAGLERIAIEKDIQEKVNAIRVKKEDLPDEVVNEVENDEFEAEQKAFFENELAKIEIAKNTKEVLLDSFSSLGEQLGVGADSIKAAFDLIDGSLDTTEEKMQAIGSVISGVFQGITEASNRNLDARISDIETERDSALNNASLSEEQRSFLEEQFDQKKKKLQRKQAENEKKLAIVNSLINTGVAVVKALPNIPLSIAVGALGLIQTGFIASRKIPEFAKGTKNAPEGVARVGERGAELIADSRNRIKGVAETDSYTYLNKGDKVFTADETNDIFNNSFGFDNMTSSIALNGLKGTVEPKTKVIVNGITESQMMRVMKDTLSKQPKMVTTMDRHGYNQSIIKGSSIIRLRNS